MPSATPVYRPELASPQAMRQPGPSSSPPHTYYDISLLKKPVWKWQIATYFFLGGLSAGGFVLARLARRFGEDESFRQVSRYGTYASLLAALPCPLLLIDDLGDKSRFHHMLRVWKPGSPMNLGTWVLTSITPIAALTAAREFVRHLDDQRGLSAGRGRSLARRLRKHSTVNVVAGSIGVLTDAAGLPLAMLLATYTGVLISNTATPVWTQNKWLAPMFGIGGMSSGASAISLTMTLMKKAGSPETAAENALRHFSTVAHVGEALTFAGYLMSLEPRVRRPFTTGSMKAHTAFTFAALAVAEGLKHVPVRGNIARYVHALGHTLSLASAFSLRWSIIYGAHESAQDAEAARISSRATEPNPYRWLDETRAQPREITRGVPDKDAISTLDPKLGYNPNHR